MWGAVITLYRHPRIWTGNPHQPWATGLYAENGRLVHVAGGSSSGAAPEADRTVQLEGAVVIPGLHDAHIHTGDLAKSLERVDVNDAGSLDEALAQIAAYARQLAPGRWIMGGRWDSNRWADPVQPTRYDLDRATGERPAALETVDAHTVWLNSAALQAIGITRDTPDPEGGQIERDADGEPTGILREGAWQLVHDSPAVDSGSDLSELLPKAQQLMLSVGLTSLTDIDGEAVRSAYEAMRADGTLAIRVAKAVRQEDFALALSAGRRTGDGDDWLATGPLKLFSDGALGSHTCSMSHPIGPDPHNFGMAVLSVDQIAQLAGQAVGAGLSVATHAIGDRACSTVVEAYSRLGSVPSGLRLRLEHAQHIQRSDVARMAQLGVVASMQPTHCTSDIDLVDTLLAGQDLVSYGWRSMLTAGVPLAFGSDSPVESPNPFFGLHAAVTRQRSDGTPAGGWQPDETVTIEQALRAHTLGAAYADGMQADKGTLEVGKLADFVAVDTDLFDEAMLHEEPLQIRHAKPVTTVVGGEVRYSA